MAIPPIPLRDNSNLIFGRARFLGAAIAHIVSGVVRPTILKPLPSVVRNALTRQRRA